MGYSPSLNCPKFCQYYTVKLYIIVSYTTVFHALYLHESCEAPKVNEDEKITEVNNVRTSDRAPL